MATNLTEKERTDQCADAQNMPQPAASLPIKPSDLTEINALFLMLQRKRAKLIGPNGDTRDFPPSIHSFFVELLDSLSQGKLIAIIPEHAALTTIQASEQLGVSRKFLVGLLEKGEIPYHFVGTHRRIYAHDLFRYKIIRDGRRNRAIRELARAEAEDGIYDEIPPLANEGD